MQRRRNGMEIDNCFGLKSTKYYDINIHHTNNFKIEKAKNTVKLIENLTKLRKGERVLNNHNVNYYILEKILVFDLIKEKLLNDIENIDRNIEAFIQYSLKYRPKYGDIFDVSTFSEIGRRNIAFLWNFFISKVANSIVQSRFIPLELKAEGLELNRDNKTSLKPKLESIDKKTEDNSFRRIVKEMAVGIENDVTLKRLIEDMYLCGMAIKNLERKIDSSEIEDQHRCLYSIQDEVNTEEGKKFLNKLSKIGEKNTAFIEGNPILLHTKQGSSSTLEDGIDEVDSKGAEIIGQESHMEFLGLHSVTASNISNHEKIEPLTSHIAKGDITIEKMCKSKGKIDSKLPKQICIDSDEKIFEIKAPKNTSIFNEERLITDKAFKQTFIVDRQEYITNKRSKFTQVVNNEAHIVPRVLKDISIVDKERFITDKASKQNFIVNNENYNIHKALKPIQVVGDEKYITNKALKDTRLADKDKFITDKASKQKFVVDNEDSNIYRAPKRIQAIGDEKRITGTNLKDARVADKDEFIGDKVSKQKFVVDNEDYNIHRASKRIQAIGDEKRTTSTNLKDARVADKDEFIRDKISKQNFIIDSKDYKICRAPKLIQAVDDKNRITSTTLKYTRIANKDKFTMDKISRQNFIINNKDYNIHGISKFTEVVGDEKYTTDKVLRQSLIVNSEDYTINKVLKFIQVVDNEEYMDKVLEDITVACKDKFITNKALKQIFVVNSEDYTINKVPKFIQTLDNEEYTYKALKNIVISDNEKFITNKALKQSLIVNNKDYITDKIPKFTKIVDDEEYITNKASKDIVIADNEKIITDKALKQNLIVNNEDYITDKIPKFIKTVDNEEYITNKASKDIKVYSPSQYIDYIDYRFIETSGLDNPKFTHQHDMKRKLKGKVEINLPPINIEEKERVQDTELHQDILGTRPPKLKEKLIFDTDIESANISNKKVNDSAQDSETGFKFILPTRSMEREGDRADLKFKVPNRNLDIVEGKDNVIGSLPDREIQLPEMVALYKDVKSTIEKKDFDSYIELKKTTSDVINNSDFKDVSLNKYDGENVNINDFKAVNKSLGDKQNKIQELNLLKSQQRRIKEEVDTRLNLHRRFWFVKKYGKIDYNIIPNKDFNYPMSIDIFDNVIDGVYKFSYKTKLQSYKESYVVEAYDENYRKVAKHRVPMIESYGKTVDNIGIEIEKEASVHDNYIAANFDITIYNLTNVQYMIIRQPKDYKNNSVLYTVTEKILAEKHPIPFGSNLGLVEIELHIPIMVDFINLLLLMWSKFYMAFTGYTGPKAIYGLLNVVHDWLILDTSLEEDSIAEYYRCFRWLRWEAEKVYNKARHDPGLSGNLWIEELIYELIDYMEMHHVNKLPEFNPIGQMDEYRQLFKDPSFDIPVIVNKFKGIRKRVIAKHKRLKDENKIEK